MQDEIARDGEGAKEDPEQRDVWPPERLLKANPSAMNLAAHGWNDETHPCSEAERREDGSGGDVDVDAVLLFVQLEVPQLVHSERLERGVEERDGVQPLEELRDRLPVDEQTREQ